MSKLGEFFLNSGTKNEESAVVEAPAFSITKVMAVVAPTVTAVAAWASSQLENISFTSGQMAAIICSLVGFLAITGAADVIARGIATSAEKAATSSRGKWVRFDKPLKGKLILNRQDQDVTIVAVSDAQPPEYLCVKPDASLSWEPSEDVTITGM